MVHPIRMPKPGQMTEECVLVAWHKEEGDPVLKGDVLFEIETDKSVMDVESFEEGILLRRLVDEGEAVPVNTVCAYVGAPGEAVPEEAPATRTTSSSPTAPPAASAAHAAPPSKLASSPVATLAPTSSDMARGAGRLRISPRASRVAAEAGIDPRTVTGTGPEGRITERDVRTAMAAARRSIAAISTASVPAPAATVEGEEEPRPLSRMRRIIAERLTRSSTTVPHFSITVAVDVTRLVALRQELKEAGTTLTVTDFVLSAAAQSLVEFPDVNSRTDGESIWPRRRVHLGLAVSLPAGLVVPVIRDADRLAIGEIHDRATALSQAAREGTLSVDDMTGSTFTVSNLGMFGVEEFSAIINPGEAAILAVASAIPTVVAIGDGIAVRQIMKLTLSADHRLVDGEMGARFLNAIRGRLEDVTGLERLATALHLVDAAALFDAVKADDLATVDRLLSESPELAGSRNADGLTPVIVARYWFKTAILDRLLAVRGDDLDVFEAAAVGRGDLVRDAVAADPSLARAWSPDGFTALHLVAFFGGDDAAEALLAAGADVNAVSRNPMQVMPLHSAAAGRHGVICRLLVANGADVNAVQRDSFTPLMAAAQNGDAELVDLLLAAGADSSARSADGRTPADFAREAGRTELADRLRG